MPKILKKEQKEPDKSKTRSRESGKPKTVLAVIIAILITALLLAGAFYIWQEYFKAEPETITKEVEGEYAPEMKTFNGEKVKIAFEYPATWGTAKEEVGLVNQSDASAGETYEITFTKNPYLSFVGASKNSQPGGIGGPCPIREFFKGTAETGIISKDALNKTEDEEYFNAKDIKIDEQKAVSLLYVPPETCSILGFQKVIYLLTPFNKKDTDFPGLVIVLDLVTADDATMHDYGYRAGSAWNDENLASQQAYLSNEYLKLITEHKTELTTNKVDDYLTDLQTGQFDEFVKTIKFNQ